MNTIKRKVLHKEEIYLAGILILFFLNTALAYFFPNPELNYDLMTYTVFLLHPAISVIGGISACTTFGWSSPHGKSFAFMTLGLLLFFLSDVTGYAIQMIYHVKHFPSLADVFSVFGYAFLLFGILREMKYYHSMINSERNMIVSIFSVFFSLLVSSIVIFPLSAREGTVFEKSISAVYGIFDVLLIICIGYILMLVMTFRGGRLFKAWSSILLAAMCMLLADVLFALFPAQYLQGIPEFKQIDLLSIGSYLLFAYGLFEMKFIIHDVQYKLRQLID